MVIGTYYVHTGEVTPQAILLATAMGLLSAGFLHANNVRDIDTDRRQHKRTLANLLSRHAATIEYAILVFVPFACAVLMVLLDRAYWPVLVVFACFPIALTLTREIAVEEKPAALNLLVRRSAGLHMVYGLLATAGFAAIALIGAS